MTSGSVTQVRALLALRWQMVRTPGVKLGITLVGLGVAFLLVKVAQFSGSGLDPAALETARQLAPQAFLGFGVLAVVAPLTAGGGGEVVPPDQLVAFPVSPRTQFVGGLALAPVNLVWLIQIFALVAETALLTTQGPSWPGALTTAAYVAALTVVGQALAWLVVGLRLSRRGRQGVVVASGGLVVAAAATVKLGAERSLLHATPTRSVVRGVVAGTRGDWVRWGATTVVLLLLLALALAGGARACAWALRRPGDAGTHGNATAIRRRPNHSSPLRSLVALDRASVWRAPALRRGAFVLAVLPGVVAAGAAVPWESLVVLPGLVAAGAGLLFGVNAFCLDGSGAVWLASLPHDPGLLFRSRLWVLTETVAAAVVIAALSGAARSPGLPSAAEGVSVVVSGLACTAVVVAGCMSMSVRHPHRAELSGPRDAVAPPGALALASTRLALPAGIVGVVLESAARTGSWWLPVTLAVPVIGGCALSLRRSRDRWADPVVRARIVQVVSAG